MPAMPPQTPDSRPSLRERMAALRNLPPFLRQVWQTSPALTLTSLGLRLIRALMPLAMLYVGKLIIDEAVHLAGNGGMPAANVRGRESRSSASATAASQVFFCTAIAANRLIMNAMP